jgi:hypothetical protein
MKRILPLLSLVLFAALSRAALSPETLTLAYDRTSAVVYASSVAYIEGSPLTLTNCTALLLAVGTNAAAPQDLTDCGVLLYVGNTSTSQVFTGTVQVATSGTFTAAITLPLISAASTTGYQTSSDTYVGIALVITNGTSRIDYRDEKWLYLRKRLR